MRFLIACRIFRYSLTSLDYKSAAPLYTLAQKCSGNRLYRYPLKFWRHVACGPSVKMPVRCAASNVPFAKSSKWQLVCRVHQVQSAGRNIVWMCIALTIEQTNCAGCSLSHITNTVTKLRLTKTPMNPLKGRDVNWLHFAIQVYNLHF